jgi:translation initiation factor 1
VARDSESRLVYSTESGGELTGDRKSRKQRSAGAHARPPEPGKRREGGGKGVRLRLDRRASGRVVTLITGLPGSRQDLEDLAGELRAACGAGGTLSEGVIELQGDHRDRIASLLDARGIRARRAGG